MREGREWWATELLKRAGEYIDLVAFHMGQSPSDPDASIRSWRYQQDPEQAWNELQAAYKNVEPHLHAVETIIRDQRSPAKIAITEGHLGLMHNVSPLLQEWLTGVYHARVMNVYQRHGDMVKIATGADFEGNRWTSNAIIVPLGRSYLMPVGSVMRLFKRVNGTHSVSVRSAPADLDIAASRTGDKIFLHVANSNYRRAVEATLEVQGMVLVSGTAYEIAPEDPRSHVDQDHPDVFAPQEKPLLPALPMTWQFPARSVTAIELICRTYAPGRK